MEPDELKLKLCLLKNEHYQLLREEQLNESQNVLLKMYHLIKNANYGVYKIHDLMVEFYLALSHTTYHQDKSKDRKCLVYLPGLPSFDNCSRCPFCLLARTDPLCISEAVLWLRTSIIFDRTVPSANVLRYLVIALQNALESKNLVSEIMPCIYLGICYFLMKHPSNGMVMMKRALALCHSTNAITTWIVVLHFAGLSLWQCKRLQKYAVQLFEKEVYHCMQLSKGTCNLSVPYNHSESHIIPRCFQEAIICCFIYNGSAFELQDQWCSSKSWLPEDQLIVKVTSMLLKLEELFRTNRMEEALNFLKTLSNFELDTITKLFVQAVETNILLRSGKEKEAFLSCNQFIKLLSAVDSSLVPISISITEYYKMALICVQAVSIDFELDLSVMANHSEKDNYALLYLVGSVIDRLLNQNMPECALKVLDSVTVSEQCVLVALHRIRLRVLLWQGDLDNVMTSYEKITVESNRLSVLEGAILLRLAKKTHQAIDKLIFFQSTLEHHELELWFHGTLERTYCLLDLNRYTEAQELLIQFEQTHLQKGGTLLTPQILGMLFKCQELLAVIYAHISKWQLIDELVEKITNTYDLYKKHEWYTLAESDCIAVAYCNLLRAVASLTCDTAEFKQSLTLLRKCCTVALRDCCDHSLQVECLCELAAVLSYRAEYAEAVSCIWYLYEFLQERGEFSFELRTSRMQGKLLPLQVDVTTMSDTLEERILLVLVTTKTLLAANEWDKAVIFLQASCAQLSSVAKPAVLAIEHAGNKEDTDICVDFLLTFDDYLEALV